MHVGEVASAAVVVLSPEGGGWSESVLQVRQEARGDSAVHGAHVAGRIRRRGWLQMLTGQLVVKHLRAKWQHINNTTRAAGGATPRALCVLVTAQHAAL
jgi:hypothetical protein